MPNPGAITKSDRIVGIEADCFIEVVQGLIMFSDFGRCGPSVCECNGTARIQMDGFVEIGHSLIVRSFFQPRCTSICECQRQPGIESDRRVAIVNRGIVVARLPEEPGPVLVRQSQSWIEPDGLVEFGECILVSQFK